MGELTKTLSGQDRAAKALARGEMIKKYGAFFVLAVLLILNIFITDNFFQLNTIWNLVVQATVTCILAMGLTFVIATAGIDISVGSAMAFVATVSGMLMEKGFPVLPAVLAGLVVGILIGLLIGFIVAYFNVQPMVLTLALMIALRSFARLLTDAKTVQLRNYTGFTSMGITRIGGVPIQLVYMIAAIVVFSFIARKTVFGKKIEAIGNNRKAAEMAGINTKRMIMSAYALLGFMTALAGLLSCARTMNCNPSSVGEGMEMNAIAAVIIGGTPMEGGKPNIIGAAIGSFIIQIISIMVNMNNISTEWTRILQAIIIILAVYLQSEKGKGRG